MNRAAARLFTSLAALSLLLGAGTTVLVLRSYWVMDRLGGQRVDDHGLTMRTDYFKLSGGHLGYTSVRRVFFTAQDFTRNRRINPQTSSGWTHDTRAAPVLNGREVGTQGDVSWRVLGVAYQWWNRSAPSSRLLQRDLVLPPWTLIGPWLVLPAWWLRGWWGRRFARRPGHCPACGYDLRGSPSGGCPECGLDGATPP